MNGRLLLAPKANRRPKSVKEYLVFDAESVKELSGFQPYGTRGLSKASLRIDERVSEQGPFIKQHLVFQIHRQLRVYFRGLLVAPFSQCPVNDFDPRLRYSSK